MSKNLLDISGKIDIKTVELCEIVDTSSKSLKIPFFVIGAKARDFILAIGYNIHTIRATQDLDFGIQVSNWDQFKKLKGALIATGMFKTTNLDQRLKFNGTIFVDIIPFGNISKPDKSLEGKMFSKKFLIVSFLGIGMIFPASFYLGSNSAWVAALIVPDDFPGIQQAIDAAQSGDTILVNPGVYIGGINFGGKDLLIQSTKGPELTTIDGNGGTGGKIEVLKMFDLQTTTAINSNKLQV